MQSSNRSLPPTSLLYRRNRSRNDERQKSVNGMCRSCFGFPMRRWKRSSRKWHSSEQKPERLSAEDGCDGYVVQLDLPELKELVSLLRRSSNNLNQLTRRVHETGGFMMLTWRISPTAGAVMGGRERNPNPAFQAS